MPEIGWFMIALSVGIPVILGSRISLFATGITKDKLTAGRAFQTSWYFTKSWNWLKTAILIVIFGGISFILPFFLTNYFNSTIGPWMGYIMIAVRAIFYPFFDIAMALNYLQSEYDVIDKATYKEEIIKQKKLSEKLYAE